MFTQRLAAQLEETVSSATGTIWAIVSVSVNLAIIFFCLGGKLDIEPAEITLLLFN